MAFTRLQGRAPSEPGFEIQREVPFFPPNFTTFGHFLQPTTTWIVLTKPSSALLCKNILAPSKVGLNRKRNDFTDLPNGLLVHTLEELGWWWAGAPLLWRWGGIGGCVKRLPPRWVENRRLVSERGNGKPFRCSGGAVWVHWLAKYLVNREAFSKPVVATFSSARRSGMGRCAAGIFANCFASVHHWWFPSVAEAIS